MSDLAPPDMKFAMQYQGYHEAMAPYLYEVEEYCANRRGGAEAVKEGSWDTVPPQHQRRAAIIADKRYDYWFRACKMCEMARREHLDGRRCLFEPTEFTE